MNTITGQGQPIAEYLRRQADHIGINNIPGSILEIDATYPFERNGLKQRGEIGKCVILLQGPIELPQAIIEQIDKHFNGDAK